MAQLDKKPNKRKLLLIAALITLISILHYSTPHAKGIEHLIYRELYLIPIVLAAFWFGMKGSLIFSIITAAIYLPLAFRSSNQITAYYVSNFTQVAIFIVFSVILGWIRDRDLKLKAEQALHSRMVAMGQAAASIAHDLKSPLMAVGGFVSQVRRKMDDQDPSAQKLDIAIAQAARMESMVKDMLAFAKPLQLIEKEVDLNGLIMEVVEVSQAAQQSSKRIRLRLDRELPKALIDANRMQQAILNLINNALEASPEGGSVEVTTTSQNKTIQIEIRDQGPGIPPDKQAQLFTPFVTTKQGGTGLGLSIAKKIIDAHEGELSLRASNSQGTTFVIEIPLR